MNTRYCYYHITSQPQGSIADSVIGPSDIHIYQYKQIHHIVWSNHRVCDSTLRHDNMTIKWKFTTSEGQITESVIRPSDIPIWPYNENLSHPMVKSHSLWFDHPTWWYDHTMKMYHIRGSNHRVCDLTLQHVHISSQLLLCTYYTYIPYVTNHSHIGSCQD